MGLSVGLALAFTAAKVRRKSCRMPRTNYTWLYAKALLQNKLPAVMPGKPIVEPYRMRVFGGSDHFDCAKAVRELGFAWPPLKQMLQDCADWYRRERTKTSPVQRARATWTPEH